MKRKVIFLGSHELGIPLVEALNNSDLVDIVGIVSQPDRPSGRGQHLKPTVISEFARSHGISLITPPILDENAALWMQEKGCDLIFVMAYGHILKKNILDLPQFGIYNFHTSILPKYRGASPIESAIACGEKVTGVTLMRMVEEMDAGDIIDTVKVSIDAHENCKDVSLKLAQVCPYLLGKNLPKICNNKAVGLKQDATKATFTRKLFKEDGYVDFSKPAINIVSRSHALTPHIGTHVIFGDILLKIDDVWFEDGNFKNSDFGEIVRMDDGQIAVATAKGTLLIKKMQRPGGKMLPVRDFLNGFVLKVGDKFTSHSSIDMVFNAPYKRK